MILDDKHWDFLPLITEVKSIQEGLHFIGVHLATAGSPSLRLNPQDEPSQCIALLNDFQPDGPHKLTRAHVLSLKLAAVALKNIDPRDDIGVLTAAQHSTNVRDIADLLDQYLRPRPHTRVNRRLVSL